MLSRVRLTASRFVRVGRQARGDQSMCRRGWPPLCYGGGLRPRDVVYRPQLEQHLLPRGTRRARPRPRSGGSTAFPHSSAREAPAMIMVSWTTSPFLPGLPRGNLADLYSSPAIASLGSPSIVVDRVSASAPVSGWRGFRGHGSLCVRHLGRRGGFGGPPRFATRRIMSPPIFDSGISFA